MARSSAYSAILNSLKIPDSVFGAEYGDISNRLNARDLAFEKLQQQELLNSDNEIDLANKQRRQKYADALPDIFSSGTPATIGDLYKAQLGKALETGNADVAAKLQEDLLNYEENERKKKVQDFVNAAGLADNVSPETLLSQFPDFPKSEAGRIFGERRKAAATKEATFPMINTETGKVDPRVPYSKVMALQDKGWRVTRINEYDPNDDLVRQADEANGQADSSSLGDRLTPWAGPGDRTRLQPKPGDEVKEITRSRTAKVGNKIPRG